eukprot:3895628-Rhodomonas_salina.1
MARAVAPYASAITGVRPYALSVLYACSRHMLAQYRTLCRLYAMSVPHLRRLCAKSVPHIV